ncbi:hypothetical protein [Bradyrhizobium lablabi]|uniref:hypothetical protein n=1 Tax=Bradyrhizobium lablabi TaxID=722472 RepID=UPI001BA5586D|nr:hypothetical protein [Bradyrhizobium lablabi]MBR0693628.1 hypothetical protein [Bradyrhizobium lablabi]
MTQLAVIDDLAARRSAAARKAVETRRARLASGMANPIAAAFAISPTPREIALHAFEQAAKSEMPDWHAAALALKAALTGDSEWRASRTRVLRQNKPTALPAPPWHDYPVDRLGSFKVRNPTIVVTFEDGEMVRAPAVSAKDKPVNIGRGLRIAIAFYQARICRRSGLRNEPGFWPAAPAITACICEETGEIFDAEQCTIRTIESRKPQDWRIRHDRRRIEAAPPRSG